MGARIVKFKFTPEENEQIEAVIKVAEEKRSVIHGLVVDCKNKPIKNAVVKLLLIKDTNCPHILHPLTHTFTDEYGQFLFGPLCPHKCYVIKVWYNDIKIRELIITPDHCDNECLKEKCDCTKNNQINKNYDFDYNDKNIEQYDE